MRGKSNFSWLIFYLLAFILAFLLTLAYFFLRRHYDSTPPQVELISTTQFISEHRNIISFRVSDFLSKVKYVKVVLSQKDLTEILYDAEVSASELNLDFPIDQTIFEKLEETELVVKLVATDGSSKQNSGATSFSFQVDKTRPQIQIISAPLQAKENTLYLCIFAAQDNSNLSVGIREGLRNLSALRADLLDPSLPSYLYANFFSGKEVIYAEDSAGYVSEAHCKPQQGLQSMKKNHAPVLYQLKNLPLAEIRIPKLSNFKRRFDDLPNFSLRNLRTEVNFADYLNENEPSNYKFYILERPLALKCPVSMQIDYVGIWSDNLKYVVGNLGMGLHLVVAGLEKVYLGVNSVCSPRNELGLSSNYIQIGLLFRESFFDPDLFLDSAVFKNQVIYPTAMAKKALKIRNLTPLEGLVLGQNKG